MKSDKSLLTSQRNILPLSTGLKSKSNKKPEDGANNFLQNIGKLLPDYTDHTPEDSTL
jgi:hypothetical protein